MTTTNGPIRLNLPCPAPAASEEDPPSSEWSIRPAHPKPRRNSSARDAAFHRQSERLRPIAKARRKYSQSECPCCWPLDRVAGTKAEIGAWRRGPQALNHGHFPAMPNLELRPLHRLDQHPQIATLKKGSAALLQPASNAGLATPPGVNVQWRAPCRCRTASNRHPNAPAHPA